MFGHVDAGIGGITPPSRGSIVEGGAEMMRSAVKSMAGPAEYGVIASLALLVALFEAVPASEIGALSVRTVSEEMTGIDAGELYEMPPEPPEEDPVDVEAIISSDLPEVIQPDQVMSLSGDTAGLGSALTVDIRDLPPVEDPLQDGIPEPGTFIPHSAAPVCTFRPMPDYPDMARQAGLEGRVSLQVFVSAQGEPLEVVLTGSSGVSTMDEAAMNAARITRWTPAKRADSEPVGVWTALIYEFILDE
jgi:protein TonB